jgi:hypothetical protein
MSKTYNCQSDTAFANHFFDAVSNPTGFSFLVHGPPLDERPFAEAGIPAMSVVGFTQPWHWHLPTDTLENLSPRTVANTVNIIYNLMNHVSQDNWVSDLEPATLTFFMPVYGVLISYGVVVRLIIAVLAIVAVVALIIFRRKSLNISIKGIVASILGIALLVGLHLGVAQAMFSLLFSGFEDYRQFIAGTLMVVIIFPLGSFIYFKVLSRFANRDTIGLTAAVILLLLGISEVFTIPGEEYLSLIPVILITMRLWLPKSKIMYYVTGISAGVLYLPILYMMGVMTVIMMPAAALYFAIFFVIFYALAKDYPSVSVQL